MPVLFAKIKAVCQDKHTLGKGRLLKLYMTRPSFTLSYSKDAYDNIITSEVLSKLDLERLILLLRTCFVHVNQESINTMIEFFHILGPNVYAFAFLRICRYAPV